MPIKGAVESRQKRRANHSVRSEKSACELKCGMEHPESSDVSNCANHCVSPSCYAAVYEKEPLEDGEVDSK